MLRKAIRLIKSWRFQQDPHSKYSSQVASYHIQPNFYLIHLSNLVDALMLLATEVGLANQHLAYYNELLLEILRWVIFARLEIMEFCMVITKLQPVSAIINLFNYIFVNLEEEKDTRKKCAGNVNKLTSVRKNKKPIPVK